MSKQDMIVGIHALTHYCYDASMQRGWWDKPIWFNGTQLQFVKRSVPTKLALVHSEISKALEGDRKDLMDEHLPERSSLEVELADAVIRIADLAGALGLDLAGAIAEKMDYNAQRADHNREVRAAAGGKTY